MGSYRSLALSSVFLQRSITGTLLLFSLLELISLHIPWVFRPQYKGITLKGKTPTACCEARKNDKVRLE
jgi:hypothetical protein